MAGKLYLFGAALIWGVAFVAQQVGMEHVGPFTFNAVRNLIGALVLVPCIFLIKRLQGGRDADGSEGAADGAVGSAAGGSGMAESTALGSASGRSPSGGSATPATRQESDRRQLLRAGLVTGTFLAIAGNLQQVGIKYTTVGKAGFITAMYIVLVPLVGIFLKRKAGWKIWVSVALSVVGLYLLSMKPGDFTLGMGDLYVLLAAAAFAFQITAVDYYAARVDNLWLACMEFLVCGLITLVLMLLFEHPTLSGILAAKWPILYAGVLSCGVAYTFQILGQRRTDPAVASLIMSLEAVISALAGWLLLGQSMSGREIFGCVIMFAAILLAQL